MKEEVKKNYFEELYEINVTDKVEQKNGLNYLSWAWAWGELKKKYPNASYKVYETENGCIYWNDGKTAWVKTSVTINEIEHIDYLPVMDFKNKSIPLENVTSFDVNKTIQRSITKAIARHGLGLSIYAGEDLPEKVIETKEEAEKYVMTFGKYKDKTLGEILKNDEKYINWLFWNEKTDQIIKDCITLMTGLKKPTEEEQKEILDLMTEINKLAIEKEVPFDDIRDTYDVKSSKDMTLEELRDCVNWLKNIGEEK